MNGGYSWGFIEHCGAHFSPCRKYFSSKCNSHSTEFFVASQSLLFTKLIHCLFNSTFFRGKSNFAICFFSLRPFITGIIRSTLRSCTFVSHSLKHKVVVFAEFLKHICERVDFSKVRGLKPATLLTINVFADIFQVFFLNGTNKYLPNTSRWLLLTKDKTTDNKNASAKVTIILEGVRNFGVRKPS